MEATTVPISAIRQAARMMRGNVGSEEEEEEDDDDEEDEEEEEEEENDEFSSDNEDAEEGKPPDTLPLGSSGSERKTVFSPTLLTFGTSFHGEKASERQEGVPQERMGSVREAEVTNISHSESTREDLVTFSSDPSSPRVQGSGSGIERALPQSVEELNQLVESMLEAQEKALHEVVRNADLRSSFGNATESMHSASDRILPNEAGSTAPVLSEQLPENAKGVENANVGITSSLGIATRMGAGRGREDHALSFHSSWETRESGQGGVLAYLEDACPLMDMGGVALDEALVLSRMQRRLDVMDHEFSHVEQGQRWDDNADEELRGRNASGEDPSVGARLPSSFTRTTGSGKEGSTDVESCTVFSSQEVQRGRKDKWDKRNGRMPEAMRQRLLTARKTALEYIAYEERQWNTSAVSQFTFAQRLTQALADDGFAEVMEEVRHILDDYVEGLAEHELQ